MKLSRGTLVVAVAAMAACERSKPQASVDSTIVRPAGNTDTSVAAQPRAWDQSAGPLLLVAGDIPSHALVILPDSANASTTVANLPRPASVTLFSKSGTVQTAELPTVSDSSGCYSSVLSAAPPPRAWSIGFVGGVVSPLPTDSLESISRADSSAFTVWMNRLASALPNDSAGRFAGLPFVVRSLWRLNLPSGSTLIAGSLERHLNQEATPLQERTFIIAERPASDSTFSTVYSERVYGSEETIQNQDLLAATLLGPGKNPALIISRDFGDAIAYSLIERGDDGRWRQRWVSGRRRC